MKLGILGPKNLKNALFYKYLTDEVCELVTGDTGEIYSVAKELSFLRGLKHTVFSEFHTTIENKSAFSTYEAITDYSDEIIVFYDGRLGDMLSVIEYVKRVKKKLMIIFY